MTASEFSEVLQLDKHLEDWDRSRANDCCPADFAFSMAFGQVDRDVTRSKCHVMSDIYCNII